MPVHWYYDTLALQRDYGRVTDYLAPKNPHPDSILWRSSYRPLNEKGDILHDQSQYWGKRGIHYHQFLQAGENTLNLKPCALLVESLNANEGYSEDDYLKRYIAFMTTPGSHRDTYVEECHRHFFTNYAAGLSARFWCSRFGSKRTRYMVSPIYVGSMNPMNRWWEGASARPVTWRSRCRPCFTLH